jgi:hypothetical protein
MRVARIAIFSFLGVLLLFVGLVLLTPSGQLAAGMIYASVFGPFEPAIAKGVITKSEWGYNSVAGQKFTRALNARFRKGSPASQLRDELVREGFVPPSSAPPCVGKEGHRVSFGGGSYVDCPVLDLKHTLHYDWSEGPCGTNLDVTWASDRSDRLTSVDGSYEVGCL